jgi:hypothetical protein
MCLVLVKQHFVPNGSLLVRIYCTLRSLHCHKCVANFLLCSPILMSRAEKCETQLQMSNAFLRRIFTFILYTITNRTSHRHYIYSYGKEIIFHFRTEPFPWVHFFLVVEPIGNRLMFFSFLSPLTLAHVFKICYL